MAHSSSPRISPVRRPRPRRAVFLLAVGLVLQTSSGLHAEKRVQVGINDWTGKPIRMSLGLPHPVTVDYGCGTTGEKAAADAVDAALKALASLEPATFGPTELPQLKNQGRRLSRAVEQYFLLVRAGRKPRQSDEAKKAVDAALTFLGAVTAEQVLAGGSDFADWIAKALLLLAEADVDAQRVRELAEPLYQAVLQRGTLRWKRRAGDLWFWNMGPVEVLYWADYFTTDEKARIKDAVYAAIPSDAGSNNNGRWGWIMDWPVGLAFEDPEILRGALKAYKHWLSFNLYPSGVAQDWESYDYSCSGKESALDVLAKYLDGLDPATFRVPEYPIADSTQRFGFEDTRNPRELANVIWKDIGLFHRRWTNHLPPDSRHIGINDTGPACMSPASFRVTNFNVSSVNLSSSAILRGGPACDAALWGEKRVAADPELIGRTFWAYLHADPSDAIHNHYDVNQLLLWWNGKYLAGDSGCDCSYESGIYNRKNGLYAMYTYSKNTVTVDQRPQYISRGQVIDCVVTPGFRLATTDAGYVYDGVYHQRTIAMLPEYLVDLSLLPARDAEDQTSHTFDYMMSGIGEFDRIHGWGDFDPGKLSYSGHFKSEEEYLRWPNLLHIYPYITWGRTRSPEKDWDVSWQEDGRHLRMMVAGLAGEARKACLGRAQLAHRSFNNQQFPRGHERLMNGVPKVVVRREGPSASFLVLYEPHSGRSVIKSWKRLDERSCEVELTNGLTDVVLLRRKQLGHAWVRYARNAWCYDPPRVRTRADRLVKVGVARAGTLQAGDLKVFESDHPLNSLFLDYGEPTQRTLLAYASADQSTSLKLFLSQEPASVESLDGQPIKHAYGDGALSLTVPSGTLRLSVGFADPLFVTAKAGHVNGTKLAQDLGSEEVREATQDAALNRSRLLVNLEYKRPRVYADGAYDGMKGVAPWTAAISDDGEFALVGTHEGYVEAFSPSGRLWRRYVKGNCLLDYNYASPGRNMVGRGHFGNPLAMTGDGNRILVGTDAGILYCIDGSGQILWESNIEHRAQSVSIASNAGRIAVAADDRLFLFDDAGKALMDKTYGAGITDVLLTRDGSRLFCTPGDGTLECLDEAGKQVWQYRPGLADVGGATMYRRRMVFTDIAVDKTGSTLVGCHNDYGIYCFDAKTGGLSWRWGGEGSLSNIEISDDGKNIAANGDGELFYLDASGKLVWKFVAAFFGYSAMRMSPDGQYLGIVNPTGEWFLVSRDKRILTRTPVLTPEPMALGMTPDAKRVVIAGIGYDVMMYENKLD